MYIIVGLGNPGREYENTRHNAGFHVIDELARRASIDVTTKKHKALVGKGLLEGQQILLVKPQTYMNLSGESIREVIDFYKVDETEQLIVISDDIALDCGAIRIRKKGSAGGHNGLKNIILHLGHDDFLRVRVGVGEKKAKQDLVSHVLGAITGEEKEKYLEAVQNAADAIIVMMNEGPDQAMNRFNAKKSEK